MRFGATTIDGNISDVRFFYDTEFIEDGSTIELISIGIVSQSGETYYACSTDFDANKANPWVVEHVLALLPPRTDRVWKSRQTIADEVAAFLLEGFNPPYNRPELWAWVGGYDHVVYAQLFGDMRTMPQGLPRFTHELKQYWQAAGRPPLPAHSEGQHDALVDAQRAREIFLSCMKQLPLDKRGAVERRRPRGGYTLGDIYQG